MMKGYFVMVLILLLLWAVAPSARTQPSEYPLMDKVAQKVIDKYQNASCEQLMAQKQQPPAGQQAEMTKKVVGLLRSDPKMRQQFLNKVAAPMANKMFECGMIP